MTRLSAMIALESSLLAGMLFDHEHHRLKSLVDVSPEIVIDPGAADDAVLSSTGLVLAGWGCGPLTAEVLDRMPALKAVLFAGGSAAAVLDPEEAARRGIVCGDAGEANSDAVAEFSMAMIILANKRAARAEYLYRHSRAPVDREIELGDSGNYGATVGLIGASRIGRRVAALLRATDLEVIVYDPYASAHEIELLGARKVGLHDLLRRSDVVSIHAPATPETAHMIGGQELDLIRDGGVIINTARGSLIDHEALLSHLRTGRLDAVLDVTDPEPLPSEHELWTLPNVTLTPHIAGATGNELRRMGTAIVDQVEALVRSGKVTSADSDDRSLLKGSV